MASIGRIRYLVELQGYRGLQDQCVAEVDPWLRVAPALCAGWAFVSTLIGEAGALWVLAGIAALVAMLPWRPFNLPYNLVIRHWTLTAPSRDHVSPAALPAAWQPCGSRARRRQWRPALRPQPSSWASRSRS